MSHWLMSRSEVSPTQFSCCEEKLLDALDKSIAVFPRVIFQSRVALRDHLVQSHRSSQQKLEARASKNYKDTSTS